MSGVSRGCSTGGGETQRQAELAGGAAQFGLDALEFGVEMGGVGDDHGVGELDACGGEQGDEMVAGRAQFGDQGAGLGAQPVVAGRAYLTGGTGKLGGVRSGGDGTVCLRRPSRRR